MYYGYIGYPKSTQKVYVITRGHETPEAAEAERVKKAGALPRGVYLADRVIAHGVINCVYPVNIPTGHWGVAV